MSKKHYIIIAAITVLATVLTGCRTTRSGAGADILEYQRKITALEARISFYESTIGSTITELESIGRRAEAVDGTVDELIYLFDDYQRAVKRLLDCYREAASKDTD